MALSESGKRGSKVSSLDDVRKKREKNSSRGSTGSSDADQGLRSAKAASSANDCHHPGDSRTTQQVEIRSSGRGTRISNRRFDHSKVERIKSELAEGTYVIDHFRVADKFIEHERYS